MRWERPPISIAIAASLYALVTVVQVWEYLASKHSINGSDVFAVAFTLSFGGYIVLGLVRRSCWPLIIELTLATASITWRSFTNPHWTDKYPLTGVFVVIIPNLIFAALILPHWKSLSWN